MYRSALTSRRDFLKAGLGALAVPILPACLGSSHEPIVWTGPQLLARPGIPSVTPVRGPQSLGLGSDRDGVLYVPESYTPDTPVPLWVALHGAGGSSTTWTSYYERAESRGMVLLAPDSRLQTWDVVAQGGFGPDVLFLDRALERTFERCRVDPSRIALAGFSDGASYALSLGRPNAELFTHLVAYSPGLIAAGYSQPRVLEIFVSHGTLDAVIPVENTRENIVPTLRALGNDVTYREFEGPHGVPAEISEAALDWFLAIPEGDARLPGSGSRP
jgi:predicted esterase